MGWQRKQGDRNKFRSVKDIQREQDRIKEQKERNERERRKAG
jgi:hypothetical protein